MHRACRNQLTSSCLLLACLFFMVCSNSGGKKYSPTFANPRTDFLADAGPDFSSAAEVVLLSPQGATMMCSAGTLTSRL